MGQRDGEASQEEGGVVTHEEHRERHLTLHKYLDELLADWIRHTPGRPTKNAVFELLQWSHQQTMNPTEDPKETQ